MKKLSDSNLILIGMVGGFLSGLFFGPAMGNIKFLGDIFLRLIQMSVIVLICGSVSEAVGSLKKEQLGSMGIKTLFVFMLTTMMASIFALIMVNVLQPGTGLPPIDGMQYDGTPPDMSWGRVLTEFFPQNIVASMSSGQTVQVIAFAVMFGIVLSMKNEESSGSKILEMIRYFNEIIMGMMHIILKLAPIGIFALLGWVTGVIGFEVIIPLAKFLLALLVAAILTFLGMLLPVCIYARLSPVKFVRKLSRMGAIAFTTTSGAVALPIEMEDCEKKFGVDPSVTRLVLPLGMTLSSAGLALYLAVACVTMFQFFNLDMNFSTQLKIVVISALTTLGTSSVPSGALVSMAVVFPYLGLPLEGIALLAGVDRFSDMIRTPMNVFCDVIAAVAVAANIGKLDHDIFNKS